MYKINDYVVYNHDICIINKIKTNEITNKSSYVMSPVDDKSLIISIPVENEKALLRNIISKKQATDLINKVASIMPLDNINEKSLDNDYKELLNSQNHENLIKIIKTAYLRNENRLNNKKKISEKDNTYFKLAEKYLYNELAIALSISPEEVKEYITKKANS